jgi:hypothetical protein
MTSISITTCSRCAKANSASFANYRCAEHHAAAAHLPTVAEPAEPAPRIPHCLSTAGTRLLYCSVHHTFLRLVTSAGLGPRSASYRPRIHDLWHSFTVATLLDWYRDGGDVAPRFPLLSTWLSHINPASTYWHLSAAPELLALVAQRFEHHRAGRS